MDAVDASGGAAFFAAGVICSFRAEDVKSLFSCMAELFPGSVPVFDSCNQRGARMMCSTWLMEAGITDVSVFFSREDEWEMESWRSKFSSVTAKSYLRGYRDLYVHVRWLHKLMIRFCDSLVRMKIVKIMFRESP